VRLSALLLLALGLAAIGQRPAAGTVIDRTTRVPAFDFLDQLYPAPAGHGKVENGDVPVELANELESFITVLGLADHVHVVLRGKDLLQTTPNDRVVVRD